MTLTTAAPWDEVVASLGLVPSARRTTRELHPCGTPAAARRHRRNGETPCEPCRIAQNAAIRESAEARRRAAGISPVTHAPCGTPAGAARHYRFQEPVCAPCRTAYNQRQIAYRAARKAQQVTS